MDKNQVDQLMVTLASKVPSESLNQIRQHLEHAQDFNGAQVAIAQMKDPIIVLVISFFLGGLGIDRFYLGDTGMGIGKLLTAGGCGIWAIIDLFLIMGAAKQKNMELLFNTVR
ncbi:MAG: TM2 domain-containing protein [Prevotella sp.]|jgi:TM2 domain-containing membrane protein YozV|nr:TM2 domain-containing protein [Prevotella sp.]MBP3744730.1 TM2 domain-containing protein [Prevotella sp.]